MQDPVGIWLISQSYMSSPCVRIQAYCHQSFTEQQPVPTVAPWLDSYFHGLLEPFGLKTDLSQLDGGRNNDFLTMATQVIRALQANCPIDDVSLFLMAHQTLDTYFPFRSTTTLLCREFNIDAPAIGLTEQELTSPYIALTTLLAALRRESFTGSGLLLVLDQATLPYKRPGSLENNIDNALVMKLTANPDAKGISVDGKRYWTEERSRKSSWIVQSIYSYLDSRRLELKDVHVVVDDSLDPAVGSSLPTSPSIADARFMSSAGLVSTMNLIANGSSHVLLVHMSNDGHLYLFSFGGQTPPVSKSGDSCST